MLIGSFLLECQLVFIPIIIYGHINFLKIHNLRKDYFFLLLLDSLLSLVPSTHFQQVFRTHSTGGKNSNILKIMSTICFQKKSTAKPTLV